MKIISLFTKAPKHKRFNYEPRFYDAKEEDRKEREERIRREIALERGQSADAGPGDHRSRMTGAFHAARRRSSTSKETLQSSLIRLGVLLFLTLLIMAFFTWGKVALYGLFLAAPLYLYMRLRR